MAAGQAVTHGTKTAGREQGARLGKAEILGRPHLMLSDVGGDDGIRIAELPKLLNDQLRLDDRGVTA